MKARTRVASFLPSFCARNAEHVLSFPLAFANTKKKKHQLWQDSLTNTINAMFFVKNYGFEKLRADVSQNLRRPLLYARHTGCSNTHHIQMHTQRERDTHARKCARVLRAPVSRCDALALISMLLISRSPWQCTPVPTHGTIQCPHGRVNAALVTLRPPCG